MAAEGMPHRNTSVLGRALGCLVRLAIRFPWPTLVLALATLGGSVWLAGTRLTYHTSRAQLLDRNNDVYRHWLAYVREFSDKEDVVIVVEGPDARTIAPILDELAGAVAREPKQFQAVFHKLDLARIRSKGLYYLPPAQLTHVEEFLEQARPILDGGWHLLSLGNMASAMMGQMQSMPPAQAQQALAGAQAKLLRMLECLAFSLDKPGAYRSPWQEIGPAAAADAMESRYLLASNKKMGFVVLQFAEDLGGKGGDFAQYSGNIDNLRRLIAAARARHPEARIGLTGLPVMENDEMRSSQSSMSMAAGLSLAGVFLVLVAGLGGFRHSLLAMGALMAGMTWAIGYTALAIGHFNILSSAFGAVLIGLGINYSTYFVARYLQLRNERKSTDEALVGTATSVAPGITVGAMSSAIAFFMAGLTEFRGVKELGLVAGGGIVLCWLAAMTVLPALLHLCDARRPAAALPRVLDFRPWIWPATAMPVAVLLLTAGGTFVLATRIDWDNFDNNLLNLQADGLESVELERKLLAETDESAWFALSMASSVQEVSERKAKFLALSSVQRVDEIVLSFPSIDERKRQIIGRLAERVARLPDRPPPIPVLPAGSLLELMARSEPLFAGNPQSEEFHRCASAITQCLGTLPEVEYRARLEQFQQRTAQELLTGLQTLRDTANPEPPQLSDLPPGLVARFLGKNGRHLMRIYSKGDIWNPRAMEQFVHDVQSVDPEATGNPMLVYEGSLQMRRSYEQATKYALLTILPFVFLNFLDLHSVLAMLPLLLGMLQMYGLMGVLGIPRNPANLIALPLMLGMGMDNGVHITHDFLRQHGRYRMSASTGAAVVLNTLTTMVGFAVLLLADHRGLQSLGRVLTIGMGCCLFSSMIPLPAILTLLSRFRAEAAEPPVEERTVPPAPHWAAIRKGTGVPYRAPTRSLVVEDLAHTELGG
jgi:hypothetical protein